MVAGPRPEVIWIDLDDSKEAVLAEVRESAEVVRIARKEDILGFCLDDKPFDLMQVVQKPRTDQRRLSKQIQECFSKLPKDGPQTVSQEMSGVFKPVLAPGKSRCG